MRTIGALKDVVTVKRLLTGAEEESRRRGQEEPGSEHLVLSALGLPDGTAVAALRRAGTDASALRSALDRADAAALGSIGLTDAGLVDEPVTVPPRTKAFRSTQQAQQVFQAAAALSKTPPHRRLVGAHVVAAACDLERGALARALQFLDLDRDALREVALDVARQAADGDGRAPR